MRAFVESGLPTRAAGPLGKLFRYCDMFGWSISADLVLYAHHGLTFDLHFLDRKALTWLLKEVWAQRVAAELVCRSRCPVLGAPRLNF